MIYPGFIIQRLSQFATADRERPDDGESIESDAIEIGDHQANDCVHQCSVRLAGDPTIYRLILAPADAEISLRGAPIDERMAKPLTDWPELPEYLGEEGVE